MAKYIFVTGGVTSSLGKGIIAASLAKLLQASLPAPTLYQTATAINLLAVAAPAHYFPLLRFASFFRLVFAETT